MVTNRHFVTFYSPGTFVHEQSTREIPEWSPSKAMALATEIVERRGARPYGFRFETRACAPDTPDGQGGAITGAQKVIKASPMHYIKGKVETLAQVEARATPRDSILLANMRGNGIARIITTSNGYSWSGTLDSGDVNVDGDGNVLEVAP